MTEAPTAAQIAGRLGPNVREFIKTPLYSAFSFRITAAWFCDTTYWAGRQLPKLGLAERRIVAPGWAALIPNERGLAVRAILMEQGRG